MVEIVNIVGSGQVERELDLVSLHTDIGFPLAKYDPEMYHGLYIRFDEEGPLITIYDSGKYIMVGSNTFSQLNETRKRFLELLVSYDRLSDPVDSWFDIQNIVGTGDLNREIDLNELIISLGLENAEYKPEKFPGIIYRDEKNRCVTSIFRTGKIVVAGAESIESVENGIQTIRKTIIEDK